jgi:hypothetical protein
MKAEECIEQEEEYTLPYLKAEEMGIVYPNICQSLHIGCNNYQELKDNKDYKSVEKSHSDAESYYKLCKE